MARQVFHLPDIGEGVAEAEIVAWHVKVGDRVAEDQPLVDVLTDKATMEVTSPFSGVITALHVGAGVMTPVGTLLAEFETEGATAPPPRPAAAPQAAPAVRARAAKLGIRLEEVRAAGARITDADLDAHIARTPGGDGIEAVPITGLRRKIAERMQTAKQRIPHFGYVEELDLTELETLRERLNADRGVRPRLSLLPFFVRALVKTLPDFPDINARYDEEAGVLRRHDAINVGIAAQTDAGLMVPVLREAQSLDVWSCAAGISRLAKAARDGAATREDLTGSTITLTSLGRLAGVTAMPIINHPEVAILCPNRVEDRAVVRAGQVTVRRMMNLSSAFDHRIVDGHQAARFIQALKAAMETPSDLIA